MRITPGWFAPLITPFTDDGTSLSEARLAKAIRWLRERGVAGLAIATDAGEFTSMTLEERHFLLDLTSRETAGEIPLVVNVSSLITAVSVDLMQHAARHGARAVLAMPFYYGDLDQAEHEAHFRELLHYADLPLVLVDPHGALGEPLKEKLKNQGAHMALPLAETLRLSMFESDLLSVHPLAGLTPEPMTGRLAELATQCVPAKLLKAIHEEIGPDCGSPRPPLRPLDPENRRILAAAMAG